MKRVKLASLLALAASLGMGIRAYAAMTISDGPIELGVWNSSFSAGKQYAEENNVPMLLFWSSPGCGFCNNMKYYCGLQNFVDWQSQRKIVMVFDEGGQSAKSFARNGSGLYPYMSIYWPKSDGTTVKVNFSGRPGGPPVTTDPKTGATLELGEQVMATVDFYTADYKGGVFEGGSFKVGDYEGNRLEAVVGRTTWVDVPLYRELGDAIVAASAKLVASFPDRKAVTNTVDWLEGEHAVKASRINFPAGVDIRAGDKITLSLLDEENSVRVQSAIAVVSAEAGLSSKDPLWIGEEFKFGRFTLDYDAAKAAVAAKRASGEEAYLLAFFTGALWCPYCEGIENSLLADPAFYEWAAENNVALVEFDQGRASSPATAAGTMAPRLLTYEPDPNKAADATVSGAGYISRHSVEQAAAAAAIARTTEYTAKWLAPETTAKRMSQPNFLLIENDAVKARFSAYRNAAKEYDTTENLGRLGDFLALYSGAGESRGYKTTSTLQHAIGDTTQVGFQISDKTAWYKVTGVGSGQIVISADSDEPLAFDLYSGSALLASATDNLVWTNAASATTSTDYRLRVRAYVASRMLFAEEEKTTSKFTASFSSELVLIPEDGAATFTPSTAEVQMVVSEGEAYRLEGIADASLAAFFEPVDAGNNIYRATVDGQIALTTLGGNVKYQSWNPGVLTFSKRLIKIGETDSVVEIAVKRTGGASGEAGATVALDLVDTDAEPERYSWVDAQLAWADGEGGEKAALLTVKNDFVFDGDQSVVFELADVSGLYVEAAEGECEVVIQEDDKAVAGVVAITEAVPGYVGKRTVVATEGSELSLRIERLDGAKGDVAARLVATGGTWIYGDTMEWSGRSRDTTRNAALRLPALADTPSGIVLIALESDGAPEDPARSYVEVSLTAADAPSFAKTAAAFSLVANVPFAHEDVAVSNISGGDVKVYKVSGTQPAGISIAWDKDGGFVRLSGTPTMAGRWTAKYRIAENRDGTWVYGNTLTVDFNVADILAATGAAPAEARTFKSVAILNDVTGALAGTLSLTIPKSGRISAKFTSDEGVKTLVAENWDSFGEDGTLTATATSKDGSCQAVIVVHEDGSVDIEMYDSASAGVNLAGAAGGMPWSRENTAGDWSGQYTTACLFTSGGGEMVSRGAVILSLRMVGDSAAENGRVQYYGSLPNGTQFSGSGVLTVSKDAKSATLPIRYRSNYDSFTALLKIERGGAAAYARSGASDPTVQRVITAADGVHGRWVHVCKEVELGDFTANYGDIYGSYYDPNQNWEEALMNTEVMPKLSLSFKTDELSDSQSYGAVEPVADIPIAVSGGNLSGGGLSFNKSSGFASGNIELVFDGGKTVKAGWRGVALPGWTGCGCDESAVDLPFIEGTCWFNDKLMYQEDWAACTESTAPFISVTVRRSFGVEALTSAYIGGN